MTDSHRSPFTIKNHTFTPPLFLAPMAGITTSAFRRLVAEFGGFGALYTEMLSVKSLPSEHLHSSPFTKRRPVEKTVIYQLKTAGDEPIQKITEILDAFGVECIDINLGCPAPEIRRSGGGKALFDNYDLCASTLDTYRRHWKGTLSVKCRLGDDKPEWEQELERRLQMFERCGAEFICVHPRFSNDKLKRPVKYQTLEWLRSITKLPLIANGDIGYREAIQMMQWPHIDGVMIGRAAVIKPWIFALVAGLQPQISYKDVWLRHFNYTCEDFPPEKAIGRIKEFSVWYAKNFYFGHEFFRQIQSAIDLQTILHRATAFFDSDPQLQPESVSSFQNS